MHSGHRWLSPADYNCWSVILRKPMSHGDISMDGDGVGFWGDSIED